MHRGANRWWKRSILANNNVFMALAEAITTRCTWRGAVCCTVPNQDNLNCKYVYIHIYTCCHKFIKAQMYFSRIMAQCRKWHIKPKQCDLMTTYNCLHVIRVQFASAQTQQKRADLIHRQVVQKNEKDLLCRFSLCSHAFHVS